MNDIKNFDELNTLKDLIKQKNNEIDILKQNIKYRDIAIHFYKNLLENKLNIQFTENFEDDITIYSKLNCNYKLQKSFKNNLKECKKPRVKKGVKPSVKSNNKKQNVKQNLKQSLKISIKKKIPKDLIIKKELTKEEKENKIIKIKNENLNELTSPNDKLWKMTYEQHSEHIKKLMQNLENTRSYSKVLSEIKIHRLHFLKFIDDDKYKKILNENTEQIKIIFKNRGSDEKKINKLVKHKVISAYAHRTFFLDNFERTTIEIDEVNLVKKCFQYKIKFKENFEIYSSENLIQNICNYQLCISDVLSMISNATTNIYGFCNIIYLPFDNNDFAFYYLESITKNKRRWKMDCKLDDISTEVWEKTLNYCIYIFKKIYQKIYHDNVYRNDFLEISQVMELEGIQLLKNILYLSNKKQFIKDFQNIIKTCNKYVPTENDNFNLYTNDPLLKINYKNLNYNNLFKKLFDNITKKNIDILYKTIQKQK